ncbi:MAG: hypothetical protein VKP63_07100 [Cyanobacteriota bacterium]|nr:hypothetical protein [Cyanobacteriota bacterium]
MSDHQTTIKEWAQYASSCRKLKAYGVSAAGSRQLLDGEVIVIDLDEERSLLVTLSERMEGEGVAIVSLPEGGPTPPPSRFSRLVTRSGGANLLYVSPELPAQGETGR